MNSRLTMPKLKLRWVLLVRIIFPAYQVITTTKYLKLGQKSSVTNTSIRVAWQLIRSPVMAVPAVSRAGSASKAANLVRSGLLHTLRFQPVRRVDILRFGLNAMSYGSN